MVALVAGTGLGLFDTSANQQNGAGLIGNGQLGRGGNGRAAVNLATGNLIVQYTDETLAGTGADLQQTRTYNSLGSASTEGEDLWRYWGEKRIRLSGTLNTAGSRVYRTTGDGHEAVYTWNGSAYVSSEGSGADDTIVRSGSQWVWTEGSSRIVERYNTNNGRIVSSRDTSGNGFDYIYNGSNLIEMTDVGSGQTIKLLWGAQGRVWQVQTIEDGASQPVRQVNYRYDDQGRLSEIVTDLTLDNQIHGAQTYVTQYTYEDINGTFSNRIASISHGDGTQVNYTYVNHGGTYKIHTVTDQNGTTTFTYNANNTQVTNGEGEVTTYHFDSQQRLVQVVTSAVGGVTQSIQYTYDNKDNVTRVTDGFGEVTTYGYDANSNLIRQESALGEVLTWTYANDQVVTETRVVNGESETFRYVYDSAHRLRYTVSAEGRVSENEYHATGLISRSIQYVNNFYDLSGFSETTTLSESQLNGWVANANKANSQVVAYQYNGLGQLSHQTEYATVDSNGQGVLDSGAVQTEYVYSAYGELLQTISVTGSNRSARTVLESRTYDGMGRVLSVVSQSGTSTTSYGNNTLTVSNNTSGLSVTSSFDNRGRLTSLTSNGEGTQRLTQYSYDDAGRLVMTENAEGARSYIIYDDANRVSHRISELGAVVGYTYNANGQVVEERAYNNRVNTSAWFNGVAVTQKSLSVAAHAHDRITRYDYDDVGRLSQTVEEFGNSDRVLDQTYDSASRVISSTLGGERTTRFYYDDDGRLVGTLNAENYLSENVYDAAGRLIQTIRYASKVQTPLAEFATLRSQANADNTLTSGYTETALSTYFFYDSQGRRIGVVDEQGYLSETVFDEANLQTRTRRYLTPVLVSQGESLGTLRARAGAQQTTTTQFDSYGRVDNVVSYDGTRTRNIYDSAGRLVRTIVAEGTADETATRTRYNAFGEITGVVSGVGEAVRSDLTTAIDEYGTEYEYDLLGRRVSQSGPQDQKYFYVYDQENRLTHSVNALGEVSKLSYNTFGDVTSTRNLVNRINISELIYGSPGSENPSSLITDRTAASQGSLDQITTRVFNTLGLVDSATDGEGNTTQYVYNRFGDVIDIHTPFQGQNTTRQQLLYDNLGRVIASHADRDGINAITNTYYDGFGRTFRINDRNGQDYYTDYLDNGRTLVQRDLLDREITTKYDAFGRQFEVTNADGDTTYFDYDDANRSLSITSPEGLTITTVQTRRGQTFEVIDQEGGKTTYTYDRDGNLKTQTDALGNVTTNTYDESGRLYETLDARGNLVRYTYDAANRLIQRNVDPNGLGLRTGYNFDGIGQTIQMVQYVAGEERTVDYLYDLNGRLKEEIIDQGGLNLSTHYTYDDAGNQLRVGRGTVSSRNQQEVEYRYDELGRRTHEIQDPGGLNITTEYRYDKNGNLTRVIDPKGNNSWRIYNEANELIYQVNALGAVMQYTYDNLGNLVHSREYFTPVSVAGWGDSPASFTPTHHDQDKQVYTIRDDDGRERFTLTLVDGTRWVATESIFDAKGNIIESRRFDRYLSESSVNSMLLGGSPQGNTVTEEELISALQSAGYRSRNWGNTSNNLYDTRRTLFAYDELNRLRFTVDPNDYLTENRYDNLGNIRFQTRYGNKLDIDSTSSNLSVASIDNLKSTSSFDRTTEYRYDKANRLINELSSSVSVRASNGALNTGQIKKRIYYNALSQITRVDEGIIDRATGSDIHVDRRSTTYEYDNAGRQIKTTHSGWYDTTDKRVYRDQQGQSDRFQRTVEVTYDAVGNAITNKIRNGVSSYAYQHKVYDAIGREIYDVDAEGYVSGKTYDANGNIEVETRYTQRLPDEIPYGGWSSLLVENQVAVNASTRTITHQYDAQNRRINTQLSRVATHYTANPNEDESITPEVSNPYGTPETQYEYNTFNELVKQRTRLDATRWAETFHYYDNIGRRSLTIDAERYGTRTEYDALGNVERITEYANRGTGPLSSDHAASFAQSTLDRVQSFTYDAAGQVYGSFVTASGATQTLESNVYNAFGELAVNFNAANEMTSYAYDALGRVTRIVEPRTEVARSANTQFANKTEVLPITDFTYDVFGNVVEERVSSTLHTSDAEATSERRRYDHAGFEIGYTDKRGQTTNYQVDVNGNITRERQAVSVSSSNTPLAYSHTIEKQYEYDLVGRRVVSLEVYNGQKTGTRQIYNAFGEVTEEQRIWGTSTLSTDGLSRATSKTYSYDNAGRVAFTRGTEGYTQYYYDLTGNVTRQEHRGNNNSQSGARITENYHDKLGNVLINRQPRFTGTDTSHTDIGILNPKIIQTYDRWGNVLTSKNAQGATTTYRYDDQNRVVEEIGHARDVYDDEIIRTGRLHKRYTYDAEGQLTVQSDQIYFFNGSVWVADEIKTRTNTYDAAGNVIHTQDATGIVEEFIYDFKGNRVASRDGLGNVRAFFYNQNGKVTSHGYLERGTNNYVVLASLFYDQADRLYKEDNRGTADIYYKFDARGNIIEKIDALDKHSRYGFDVHGNKTTEDVYTGTWERVSTTNYYYSSYQLGRISSKIAPDETNVTYSYTRFGEVAREDNGTSYIEYTYWQNGLIQSKTDSDDKTVRVNPVVQHNRDRSTTSTYHYNIAGQRTIEQITSESQFGISAGPIGLPGSFANSGSTTSYFSYDQIGRLEQISSPSGTVSNQTREYNTPDLQYINYDYDAWDNRAHISTRYSLNGSTAVNTRHRYYTFDNEGRVLIADSVTASGLSAGTGVAYTYDNAGNIATETQISNTYEQVGTNRVPTQYGGTSYGGTITYIDQPVYEWVQRTEVKRNAYNEQGQLTSVFKRVDSGPETNYATHKYNDEGFKYESITEGRKTTTVYDTSGRITSVTSFDKDGLLETISDEYTYEADGNLKGYRFMAFDGVSLQDSQDVSNVIRPFSLNSSGFHGRFLGVVNSSSVQSIEDRAEFTNTYTNTYAMTFTGRQLTRTEVDSTQQRTGTGDTINFYDHRGRLVRSNITEANPAGDETGYSNKIFIYNADDQIINSSYRQYGRDEFKVQTYFYHQGQSLANLGDEGVNFAPIQSKHLAGDSPTSYTVVGGETLANIAQSIYGDSSLWYVIADTNGLSMGPVDRFTSDDTGRTLRIPANDQPLRNNATTFQAYNPSEIIGDLTPDPAILPPPKKSCNAFAIILVAVVAAVVTVVTAGAALAAIAPGATTAAGATASGLGVFAAGGTAIAGGFGAIGVAAAAIGGFVGSLAGQAVGVAAGVQDKISLRSAFASSLTTAFSAGLGAAAGGAGSFGKFSDFVSGTGFKHYLARGATNYVVGQATNRIAGLQTSFSWRGLAAASFGHVIQKNIPSVGDSLVGNTFDNYIGSAATAELNYQFGERGAVHHGELAVDAFGNALGQYINHESRRTNFGNKSTQSGTSSNPATIEASAAQNSIGVVSDSIESGRSADVVANVDEVRLDNYGRAEEQVLVTGVRGESDNYVPWWGGSYLQQISSFQNNLDRRANSFELRTAESRIRTQQVWDNFHRGVNNVALRSQVLTQQAFDSEFGNSPLYTAEQAAFANEYWSAESAFIEASANAASRFVRGAANLIVQPLAQFADLSLAARGVIQTEFYNLTGIGSAFDASRYFVSNVGHVAINGGTLNDTFRTAAQSSTLLSTTVNSFDLGTAIQAGDVDGIIRSGGALGLDFVGARLELVGARQVGRLNVPIPRNRARMGPNDGPQISPELLEARRVADVPNNGVSVGAVRGNSFNAEGKLFNDGSLPLLNQGQRNTCGPNSCGMVLDTLLPDRNVTNLGGLIGSDVRVVRINELADNLNANGLNATFNRRLDLDTLQSATSGKNPAIVAIQTPQGGHAVVVDGFTTKLGRDVVSIRNPWGEAYFQTVDEFKKVYLKQGVTLE